MLNLMAYERLSTLLLPNEFHTFMSEVNVHCISFSANLRSKKLRKLDVLTAKHRTNGSPQSSKLARRQTIPVFLLRVINTTNVIFTSKEEDLPYSGLNHCLRPLNIEAAKANIVADLAV